MLSAKYKNIFIIGIVLMSGLILLPVRVNAFTLHRCFSGPIDYYANWSYSLQPNQNVNRQTITSPVLAGTGPSQTARCTCSGTSLTATSTIKNMIFYTTPLTAGRMSGFGYLTNKFDVNLSAYTNTEGATDINNLIYIPISSYPTTTPVSKSELITSSEGNETVCEQGTQPKPGTPSRQFKWNATTLVLYVKESILGVEIIPDTLVLKASACLYTSGSTQCTSADAEPVSNIWISGSISAPLSCTINAGTTIEVDFGVLNSSSFKYPATPPEGFTLKEANISFHCDDPAASNSGKIKLTLVADQGIADPGYNMIAKMIGRDDIGVRVYDSNSNYVQLDGSTELPITLDSQGNGTVKIKAAPVSTTLTTPAAGKFEGNVTVKMEIR